MSDFLSTYSAVGASTKNRSVHSSQRHPLRRRLQSQDLHKLGFAQMYDIRVLALQPRSLLYEVGRCTKFVLLSSGWVCCLLPTGSYIKTPSTCQQPRTPSATSSWLVDEIDIRPFWDGLRRSLDQSPMTASQGLSPGGLEAWSAEKVWSIPNATPRATHQFRSTFSMTRMPFSWFSLSAKVVICIRSRYCCVCWREWEQ